MELTEIMGMAVGERRRLRANGRHAVGDLLHDDNPYIDEVLRVVEASRPVSWDQDRIDDEDEFDRRPGQVTTDIVVERVQRSPSGAATVDTFWSRYREPVKVVAGELRVNARAMNEDGFFHESGQVRPLARETSRPHPALSPVRSEPVTGFDGSQRDQVYALPPDGWYEAWAMRSPSTSEHYFFRLENGEIVELLPTSSLDRYYTMHWTQLHEAGQRFRSENGTNP